MPIGGFLTVHSGYIIITFVRVCDLVDQGFTIERIGEYLDKLGEQGIATLTTFGMSEGQHAYFPMCVVPVTMALSPKVEQPNDDVGAYVIHYVLDRNVFPSLSEKTRGEVSAHIAKSMSHGLEKFWVVSTNMKNIKGYIDAWASFCYPNSDGDMAGFG